MRKKPSCKRMVYPTADLMSVPVLKSRLLRLDMAGHLTTRRGQDVACGPDVVHHCTTPLILSHQSVIETSSFTVMGTNYLTASYNYFLTTFEISSYNYSVTTLDVM